MPRLRSDRDVARHPHTLSEHRPRGDERERHPDSLDSSFQLRDGNELATFKSALRLGSDQFAISGVASLERLDNAIKVFALAKPAETTTERSKLVVFGPHVGRDGIMVKRLRSGRLNRPWHIANRRERASLVMVLPIHCVAMEQCTNATSAATASATLSR